jgi:hypothetical protein
MKYCIALLAVATVLVTSLAFGLHAGEPTGAAAAMDCTVCHVAVHPADEEAAALKPCPRPVDPAVRAPAESEEVPDFLILDKLSELYVPVVFPHKLHAAMGEMAEGCSICHHRNPEGPILSCSECHGGPSNPVNLRQPGLKGAYHRQCLGCHREWTHETNCVICHAKREPGVEIVLPEDPTDIIGMLHPNVEIPDVKVYEIEHELLTDMPFVTFHHKEHIELFGHKCVDCHQHESCNRCHDTVSRPPHVRLDPHEDCIKCHQQQIDYDCTHCHDSAVRETGFVHAAATGFDTALYHAVLGCTDCHTKREQVGFTGLATACSACHAPEFEPAEFDHATTGTPLGEIHSNAGCADCHTEGIGGPVSCAMCHDEEMRPGGQEIP